MEYIIEARTLSPETHIAHRHRNPAGLSIAPRIIEDFEFVLITEGSGEYVHPGGTIRFEAGGLILTPPYLRHAYRQTGRAVEHYALHFDPSPGYSMRFRGDAAAWDDPASVRFTDERNGTSVPLPTYMPGFKEAAEGLFQDVVTRHEEFRRDLIASASLRLAEAVLGILALVVETCAKTPKRLSSRGGLARAAAIMDSRYAEELSVPALAEEAGYAANYFSVEFARSYGLSPVEYLRERRVARAKELLRSADHSVKEIAALVGFEDPYYFSKVFSKRTGLSPTRYRALAKPGG